MSDFVYHLLSSAKNCRILSILEYMAGLGSIFTTFQSLPSIEVSDVCKHIERCISRQIEESISSSFQCVYKYFDKIEAFFVQNIIHCCSPISWDLLISIQLSLILKYNFWNVTYSENGLGCCQLNTLKFIS